MGLKTDEYTLFSRYKQTKDKIVRDELIEKYLYIAQILSKRFMNKGIDYDDIYQVASLGIVYAVERFDPDRGVSFATYATPTVLGEIRKYFRDKGNFIKVPRTLYEIFYKAERYKHHYGVENMPLDELARVLNLPYSELEKAYKMGDVAFIQSLEYEAAADGRLTFADVLGREDSNYLMIEDKLFIEHIFKELNSKERELVNKRCFDGFTQIQIAKSWGVSQMYVSRLEKQTLKKLRDLYFYEWRKEGY